jgi:CubicO group peptidase (beta-lactamase class C family)
MDRRRYLGLAGALAMGGALPRSATADAQLRRYTDIADAYPDFNGVLLAGVGGRIVYREAFGIADAEAGVATSVDTRFETGSVSKWIAAMVVMKLIDLGRLALDEPILRYLPQYRADTGEQLTLRHLLSHSSGVPNDIIAARNANPAVKFESLDQLEAVKRYASGDLRFKPGTAWDYSHSNWLIVKAIVEQASGKSYADCVDGYLLAPTGLKNSGLFSGESDKVPGMAVAYAGATPPRARKISPVPGYMAMAGGFYTTVADLLHLMDAVLSGDLLTKLSRQTLMRTNMAEQHYALGGRTRIATIAGREREAAWEDGSNGGFRLLARRVLEDGHTVIVMNNTSFDYEKIGQIGTRLMEQTYA